MKDQLLAREILRLTFRVVPAVRTGSRLESQAITRQLDIALMSVGFKLSTDLIKDLNKTHSDYIQQRVSMILETVSGLTLTDITLDQCESSTTAWVQKIVDIIFDSRLRKQGLRLATGWIGTEELLEHAHKAHAYTDILDAHDQLTRSGTNRRRIFLQLGRTLSEEAHELYCTMAKRQIFTPDQKFFAQLAEYCLDHDQPSEIEPEQRTIINTVRVKNRREPLVQHPTDILRLACSLSGGDANLIQPTRFRSFPRSMRLLLMKSLHKIIAKDPRVLLDITHKNHRERWKRLGEQLHPHEYPELHYALEVFDVARGDMRIQ